MKPTPPPTVARFYAATAAAFTPKATRPAAGSRTAAPATAGAGYTAHQ